MDIVEEQVLAYNARDLERFIATYSPDVVIEDGENNLLMRGHDQMRERYGARFNANPELHCRIVSRMRSSFTGSMKIRLFTCVCLDNKGKDIGLAVYIC